MKRIKRSQVPLDKWIDTLNSHKYKITRVGGAEHNLPERFVLFINMQRGGVKSNDKVFSNKKEVLDYLESACGFNFASEDHFWYGDMVYVYDDNAQMLRKCVAVANCNEPQVGCFLVFESCHTFYPNPATVDPNEAMRQYLADNPGFNIHDILEAPEDV